MCEVLATLTGVCAPLGAQVGRFDGQLGVNFAVFSQNATAVVVSVFDALGQEMRYVLSARTGYVWHGFVVGLTAGTCYGFRVMGENDAVLGRYFNSQKLLCDPYARALIGRPRYGNEEEMAWFHYADGRDNAHLAPKSIVVDQDFAWQGDVFPKVRACERVIYEASVRGLTQLHAEIETGVAGTFLALAHPKTIAYLCDLGVTTLELLPITYHLDEPHLQRLGLSNYWGYNTLGHCAVDGRFASDGCSVTALQEFKTAVRALHAAGIEVVMDIVFNHTVEQGLDGPMLCQKGIDGLSYYWHNADGSLANWTGCGNTINASHRAVMRWIMDVLRYWVQECHVDGFRFDLATQLGRKPEFSRYAPFFTALYQDPILSQRLLIAEPWDLGEEGYQLGQFPNDFLQWNDRFRDDMRAFWLHESGNLGAFCERFSGSADLFDHDNMLPRHSVNFITAHDGFCLQDLVSYNDKHNQANGEDNRDGHSHNLSYNHGVEGDTDEVLVVAARRRSAQALLASVLLANGTPMLLAGDAMGHTQQGNNNTYCQDNALTWLAWQNADVVRIAWVKALLALRRELAQEGLYDTWWGEQACWCNVLGQSMQAQDWDMGLAIKALQLRLGVRWVFLINAKRAPQEFVLGEGCWRKRLGEDGVNQKVGITVEMQDMGFEVYERCDE